MSVKGPMPCHPAYEAVSKAWQLCRDLYSGSDAVKAGTYLPQPAGMDANDFKFYRERALYYNAFKRTVQALGGTVFMSKPDVQAKPIPDDQLADLTMRDESMESVSRWLVTQLLETGRAGILLDMPDKGGRPYWVPRVSERIVNWRTARVGEDPSQLVMVMIREDESTGGDEYELTHKTQPQYRQLALVPTQAGPQYQVRVWTQNKERNEFSPGVWIVPTRRSQTLDFIPFTFANSNGITTDVERPPLEDLAHVAVSHYRNSADHEHGLFYTAIPTPWAAGVQADQKLRIGPSVCWNLDKDGKAGMLEFSGAGLAAIRDAMASKERLMATLGARLLEDPTNQAAETATAVRLRHSGEGAALSVIAASASAALTRVARWHAWLLGVAPKIPTDVTVELSGEFVQIRATPEEIRTALLSVQAGEMAFETWYSLLTRGGWARKGVSAEDEQAAIAREGRPPEPDGGTA